MTTNKQQTIVVVIHQPKAISALSESYKFYKFKNGYPAKKKRKKGFPLYYYAGFIFLNWGRESVCRGGGRGEERIIVRRKKRVGKRGK